MAVRPTDQSGVEPAEAGHSPRPLKRAAHQHGGHGAAGTHRPGFARRLTWTVVWDDAYDDAVHALWDTEDEDEAREAAVRHAETVLGPLEGGTVASTRGDIRVVASTVGYPEPDRLVFSGRRWVDVAKNATYSTADRAPWPLTDVEQELWNEIHAESMEIRARGNAPDFPVDWDY